MASLGSTSTYSNSSSRLLMDSFKEIGAFSHSYKATSGTEVGKRCSSYNDPGSSDINAHGITAVSIDTEGKYVASATLEGCITVHNFEELYSTSQEFSSVTEKVDDESKHLMHINVGVTFVSRIKWNPRNSEQLACTWRQLLVYDLNDVHHPTEYLLGEEMKKPSRRPRFEDLSFAPKNSLMAACYKYLLLVWDPRAGKTPEKFFFPKGDIMACQFGEDDKSLFAAGEGGKVYGWDLRFYNMTSAEGQQAPPIWELPQSKMKIRDEEVFRISSLLFNPSNNSQLAFNTENGWCGVLDTTNFQIKLTHAHPLTYHPQQSSWLGESSIYATPFVNTLRLMDFHPSSESPCYLGSSEEAVAANQDQTCHDVVCSQGSSEEAVAANPDHTCRDVVCSQGITSCAAHPLLNAIVAGTNRSSLMLITDKNSCEVEEEM